MATAPRVRVEFHEMLFAMMVPEYESDINCVLEFTGHLEYDRLVEAVLCAIAECPLWGYRFVEHWRASYWRPMPRADRRSLITLYETSDLQGTEQVLLAAPVSTAVHVHVMRTPERDVVCFRVDHRLADAAGSRAFIASVYDAYQERRSEPPADGPFQRVTFAAISHVATRKEMWEIVKQRIDRAKAAKKAPKLIKMRPRQLADVDCLPHVTFYREGALDELRAKAMQRRATPSMAVQAAAYLAYRELLNPPPEAKVPMPLMIDLRRYLKKDSPRCSASMLIGMAHIHVPADLPSTVDEVLPTIVELIKELRGPRFGLLDSPLVTELPLIKWWLRLLPAFRLKKVLRSRTFEPDPVPTLCVTDQGDYGPRGQLWGETQLARGFCSTGVWKVPSISIGVSTSGSQFTISCATAPDSFCHELASGINRHLHAYMNWSDRDSAPRPFGQQPSMAGKQQPTDDVQPRR